MRKIEALAKDPSLVKRDSATGERSLTGRGRLVNIVRFGRLGSQISLDDSNERLTSLWAKWDAEAAERARRIIKLPGQQNDPADY